MRMSLYEVQVRHSPPTLGITDSRKRRKRLSWNFIVATPSFKVRFTSLSPVFCWYLPSKLDVCNKK